MSKENSQKVKYLDKSVEILHKPAKDETITVYPRPGDKIHFDFDVSKSSFKLVGDDVVVKMPDGGEIVFVSLAIQAFEENPPQIIMPNGSALSLEELLLQVDDIKETPIKSVVSDEIVALQQQQDKLKKELENQQQQLEEKAKAIEAKEKALATLEKEQEQIAQSIQESEAKEDFKLLKIEDNVDVSSDVAEENDYNAYFRPIEDASSVASDTNKSDVTATFDFEIGFFQTQKQLLSRDNELDVYGGGGSVRARFDESGEAQMEAETLDFSSKEEKMKIEADNSAWFDEQNLARLIAMRPDLPDGFAVEEIKISGVPDDFELVGGKNLGGGVWVVTKADSYENGFVVSNKDLELILKYNAETTHADFVMKVEATARFDIENIIQDPLNPQEIIEPKETERVAVKEVGIQVKDVHSPDDFIYDSTADIGFVLSRTPNANIINTSHGDSEVIGGMGEDTVTAYEGNDTISTRDGDDTIIAGLGDDTIDGGAGRDLLDFHLSQNGIDVSLLEGRASGEGQDKITGIEDLIGSGFADTLEGNDESNVINALDGDDTLKGAGGDDTLFGDIGNDVLLGGSGNDYINGGAGNDTASFKDSKNSVTVQIADPDNSGFGIATGDGTDVLKGIENAEGSEFDDTLLGDEYANVLSGLGGDDYIKGGKGNDQIDGGEGVDTVDLVI